MMKTMQILLVAAASLVQAWAGEKLASDLARSAGTVDVLVQYKSTPANTETRVRQRAEP